MIRGVSTVSGADLSAPYDGRTGMALYIRAGITQWDLLRLCSMCAQYITTESTTGHTRVVKKKEHITI